MENLLSNEVDRVFKETNLILDDKLLAECVSICQMYVIEPDDLRFKLEAINYKPSATLSRISPITLDTLSAVKVQIQQNLAKQNSTRMQTKSRGTAQVDRSRIPASMNRNPPRGPVTATTSSIKQISVGSNVATSSNIMNGSNVSFVGPLMDSETRRKRAYRYMYEKISERSESLDQIIDTFAELIRGHYDISDFGDPAASTDDEVTIVGRITRDAESETGAKLAEGAITIESSRMLSSGARVPLVLDPTIKIRGAVKGVCGIGIYPGAIVALKGKNGGGGYFLATEVLGIPPFKPSPAAEGIMNPKLDPTVLERPASMFVACGPFTADADTSYRPWRALLHQIKAQKPDVLLLIGPFVDAAHPKIKLGESDHPPSNLFHAHFVGPLKAFLSSSPGSIVLMVPSVRDIISDHAAFPQPEFGADFFNSSSGVHMLPNPARFTINDVAFAATSVDTLFHLRKEEYFKRGIEVEPLPVGSDDLPTDTMANLCRHLLLQRSFYPIFPSPLDLSSDVNLDVTHYDGVRMVDEGDLDYAPDILILPSRLKHFTKTIHSTTVLNPAYLSKGMYGTISLAPRSAGTPKNRVSVGITRLEASTPAPVTEVPTAISRSWLS